MSEPDYLARLHASFGVPQDEVVDFVERGTRLKVVDIERLTLGDENEVYRFRVAGAHTLIYVRIRRPESGTFDAEVWAMDQVRSVGVPVPTVLALGKIGSPDALRAAMVIANSPGRPLDRALPTLTADQRHIALTNLGRALALMHTIRTPGVARPDPDGRWPDPHDVMDAFVVERRGQRPQLESAGLTAAEIDRIIGTIGTSPDIPAATDPVLCHGDLHPGHAFVNEQFEICGVIDWGLWHCGSAVDDLSTIYLHYPADDFETILAGHGHPDGPDFRRRLALAVINQTVGHIAWSVSIDNSEGSGRGAAMLRRALRQLDPDG